MANFLKKPGNLKHNIILSYFAIAVVFVSDLFTPLGYAVWILYLVPLHIAPYKIMSKLHIYLFVTLCSILIWAGYYFSAPGIPTKIALFNRTLMTIFYWVITYGQVQKSKALKKLARSEENLKTAQSLAHIGSYEYDLTTGNVTWTKEVFAIYEHDINKGEPSYSEIIKYCHPDDLEKTLAVINKAARDNNTPFEVEFRIITPNNKIKSLYYTGISVLNSSGEAIRRIGTVMDITERRMAEEELRKSEERFRIAQEVSPDGFIIFKPVVDKHGELTDLIFTFENEAAAQMNGTNSKEVVGHRLLELFPGHHDTQFFRTYKKVYETRKAMEFEDHYQGETIVDKKWFRIVAVPVSDGLAILAQDITARIKAEEALKDSQAKLLDAQKLARIGNYTIDFKNNGAMEWSDEMYNIWEIDKNKPFPSVDEVWKLVHPDDWDELNRVLTVKTPESERVETEFRIVFPGNRIKYVQIITRVSFDESGNLIRRQGVEIDITERKVAQMELEKTLLKLEKSNKELEQFAYIASHDLQEPLRMVASYMTLLEQKYKDQLDDRAKQYIYYAVDGSKRMGYLIRDLLVYSRVTSKAKEFTEVDLNKTYLNVMNDLQILIREKDAIVTSSGLPTLSADSVQMHQLLQNLIGNALKFHADRTPEVVIKAKRNGNAWLFSVKDNGIGIDHKNYERIFQIFQRLHEPDKYSGTGIGLAVCKKIVERHEGSIWVESEAGIGTTFYFTLPDNKRIMNSEESDKNETLTG